MKKIKYLIIEDQESNYLNLKEDLLSYPDLEEIKRCKDGESGLEAIHQYKPELVFLDIQMPGIDGFELIDRLEYFPAIIFVTGFTNYALKYAEDGYSQKSSFFLTKPIKKNKLAQAIQQAYYDIEHKSQHERIEAQKEAMGYLHLDYRDEHGESKHILLSADKIAYLNTPFKDYLEYHLVDGQSYIVRQTIKDALKKLEKYGFLKIHQSCIVNIKKILEFNKKNELLIDHPSNPLLSVSFRLRPQVRKTLKELELD